MFASAFVAADIRLRDSESGSSAQPLASVERPATADAETAAPFVPPVADASPEPHPAAPDAAKPTTAPAVTSAAAEPGRSTAPSGSDAVPDPGSRRFAWAPTDGASGYHMELFQGNTLVFAGDTVRPEITIPAKWRFNRRVFRFDSLQYRWYVWPVVSGKRTSQAVVQARLVVEDR